jgi:two-component system sensor histidine kinase YesM
LGLPFIIVLPGLAASAVVIWLWIIRPYLKIEKNITDFLEGYTPYAASYQLSPATERLYEHFREVLSPTELFNMNKRQAQYLALQNQINPHFLYNTLESIRSEALLAGLGDVANMTESLATFFRYTITNMENLVSVEDELQNCETYFNIQKYRFGDRLTLDIDCLPEDQKSIFQRRLPKLTMQPILENSIIHGTELKLGIGHLTIHLEETEKLLLIRISDDGLGMDEETLAELNSKLGSDNLSIAKQGQGAKGGLALINVDNRIRLLFGSEYGLHVFSILGIGTDVEITLPAINSDREVNNKEALL